MKLSMESKKISCQSWHIFSLPWFKWITCFLW